MTKFQYPVGVGAIGDMAEQRLRPSGLVLPTFREIVDVLAVRDRALEDYINGLQSTPIDTNSAHIQPVGTANSGGGAVNPGNAAAVDHAHAGSASGLPLVSGLAGFNVVGDGTYFWQSRSPVVTIGTKMVGLFTEVSGGAPAGGVLAIDTVTGTTSHIPVAGWVDGSTGFAATFGIIPGGVSTSPTCIAAVDSSGRMWVLNSGNPVAGFFGYFDTSGSTWTTNMATATLPATFSTVYLAGMGIINDIMYAYMFNGTLWSYDTRNGLTGAWTQLATQANTSGVIMPVGCAGGKLVVVDGTTATRIYTPGGSWTIGAVPPAWTNYASGIAVINGTVLGFWNGAAVFSFYNVATNTWTQFTTSGVLNHNWTPAGVIGTAVYMPNLSLGTAYKATRVDLSGAVTSGAGSTVSGDLVLGGHLISAGLTPTVVAGAALGTAPPAPTITGSTDTAGSVGMGTGTATAAGNAAVVTFVAAYAAAPKSVDLTPLNAASAALQPYVAAIAAGSFTIGFGVAPAVSQAGGTYRLAYQVIG